MSSEVTINRTKKYMAFIVLAFAAGVCFKVPYLKTVFYDSMILDLKVNNTELGALLGTYSIFKAFIYIPCGILVDKYNTRYMLTFSMALLTVLTFWYGFLPDYNTLIVVHALYALANAICWVSFIKAIRLLGTANEQGSMFGYSEGLRALSGTGITFIGLWALTWAGENPGGLNYVLFLYAACYLVLTVALFILTPDDDNTENNAITLQDYLNVLRYPGVWLVALLVGLCYSVQIVSEYTTPYLTQVFGMTIVAAGLIGTIRSYLIGVFSAPFFGKMADKMGSPAKMTVILMLLQAILGLVFYFIPGVPGYLTLAVVTVIIFSVFMYGALGIYYATMGEATVPVGMTGTAVGIISVLGYLPDTFLHTLLGSILDNNPGSESFRTCFLIMIGFALAGALVALLIFYKGKQNKPLQADIAA